MADNEPLGERLARVETKVDSMQDTQTLILKDIREIRDDLNKAKGGWVALATTGVSGGLVGGFLSNISVVKKFLSGNV